MFRRLALRRRLSKAGAGAIGDRDLKRLAGVLDSSGTAPPTCVPGSHLLRLAALRITLWPDLTEHDELRRLPQCSEPQCCNPHHWSRLCKPDSPPPPYSLYEMDDVKQKDSGDLTEDARRTDHERLPIGSLATDGEEKQSWDSEWCRLAYWEQARRVGRQFGVRPKVVDVFGGSGGTCGSDRYGLCLDSLGDCSAPGPEQVRRTRAKIGLGVRLSLESDEVWLYNRSREPVFVSSPALDIAVARALLVWRVAPAHCLCIYRPTWLHPQTLTHIGPVDLRSVRISFAKGWGPKYSRQDVTACPCWIEVLLAPHS